MGPAMLTHKQVDTIKRPGRYHDRDGLYLQVRPSGAKSWLFIYMRDRRQRYMGLGSARAAGRAKGLTLAEARTEAQEAHRLLRDRIDPIDEKRALQRSTTSRPTFREIAEQFIASKEAGWRSQKTAEQFRSALVRYAYPRIGSLPSDSVTVDDIVEILKPIWASKPVMADHVRTNIAMVLSAAKALGRRSGDNPAQWRGVLEHVLPRPAKVRRPKHHAALHYQELPGFVRVLRERETIAAAALEFTILTAARTSEVIGAQWDEIDLAKKIWMVPATRMKGHRTHRVPLSNRAVDILAAAPREHDNEYVFVGARRGKGITNMPMLKLVWSLLPGMTVHGFRSSFRDWVSEKTSYPRETAEAALAHALGDRTEIAYARSDLFDKRRNLMRDWATYLG